MIVATTIAVFVAAVTAFFLGVHAEKARSRLDGADDAACGICSSPKCRACNKGLMFGHLSGTPYCSKACADRGPKSESWSEFVARGGLG